MATKSEDTVILLALTPDMTDLDVVHEALVQFCNKKKELDYNDRFNVILFTDKGPQYLDDFTLKPEKVLSFIRQSTSSLSNAPNVAGAIFITSTFVAEVFKKISGKTYRLVVLTDDGSLEIPETHIPFIEDLLDKVKEIPFIMDIIRINCDNPSEDLKLMRLARRTGGDLHEIEILKRKRRKAMEPAEKNPVISMLDRLSKTKEKITKKFKSEDMETNDSNKPKDLFDTLNALAKKKELSFDDDGKMDIDERNELFFESLADIPVVKEEREEHEKCSICFRNVKNLEMVECPSCQVLAHEFCLAIWSKTSNIGIPHVFRCPSCFTLIRMEETLIKRINSIKTPRIEIFDMEDIVLEEYLESIESKHEPQVITVEDALAIPEEEQEGEESIKILDETEGDYEMKDEEELQIIWCPHCGKMTSNEFMNCPQCGQPLDPKKKMAQQQSVERPSEKEMEESIERKEIIKDLTQKADAAFNDGDYPDAINKAERILQLAKNMNDSKLEFKYREMLATSKEKIEKQKILTDYKGKIDYLKQKFEDLIKKDKIIRAEHVIKQFKENYASLLEDPNTPEVKQFLDEAKATLDRRIRELEEEEEEILEGEKIELETPEVPEAPTSKETGIKMPPMDELMTTDSAEGDDDLEKRLMKMQEQIKMIKKAHAKSNELEKEYKFDEAIDLLEKTVKAIEMEELSKYKVELTERKVEIRAAKKATDRLLDEMKVKREQLKKNKEEGNYFAALQDTEKILQVIELTGKEALKEKYEDIKRDLAVRIKKQEDKVKEEREEILQKKKELEEYLQFEYLEKTNPPLLKNLLFSTVKEGLNAESDTLMKHVEQLLKENLTSKSNSIDTTCYFTYGENDLAVSKEDVKIEKTKINKKLEDGKFMEIVSVHGVLASNNPQGREAEELELNAIIPYSHELINVEVDGMDHDYEVIGLRRAGLEIKLESAKLPPNEQIEIRFNVRERAFRTMVAILKDHFKIITIHGDISPLSSDGVYEILMPFKVVKEEAIKMIIIEDILPSEYKHYIIDPKEQEPEAIFTDTFGNHIDWIDASVKNQTYLFQYRLFNFYRFEDVKQEMSRLFKKGLKAIENDDLMKAVDNARKIVNTFEEDVK